MLLTVTRFPVDYKTQTASQTVCVREITAGELERENDACRLAWNHTIMLRFARPAITRMGAGALGAGTLGASWMRNADVNSLTDQSYWDRAWSGRATPEPLNPRATGLNGTVSRRWHDFFWRAFASLGLRPGDRMLEAGCGGSVFLPYFAKEYGLSAEGIDNSLEGCELSNAIARQSGIATPIHYGDILDPPESMRAQYRMVFSCGLAEHFSPTTSIVRALTAFLRPDGCLITIVPNMHGLVGALQNLINPRVYDLHVPLSPSELSAAHRSCGLSVLDARHIMTVNFSVVNFAGSHSRIPERLGLRLASWTSKAVWSLQRAGLPELPNGWTSPYVAVVARQPH